MCWLNAAVFKYMHVVSDLAFDCLVVWFSIHPMSEAQLVATAGSVESPSHFIDVAKPDGSSERIDVWDSTISNAQRFGATCLGQNRFEKMLLWFQDTHQADWDRTVDGRIRVPWFASDGVTRNVVVNRHNRRQNMSQVLRLAESIRQQRICYQMRSPPFAVWSPPRRPPLQTFSWGHMVEAVYWNFINFPDDPNVKAALAEGFLIPQIFHCCLPVPVLLWGKWWSNSFNTVQVESVFEWYLLMQDLAPKFVVYIQGTACGSNSQSQLYRNSMVLWYSENTNPEILRFIRKSGLIKDGEIPWLYDRLLMLTSVATKLESWNILDELRTYHGWNIDDAPTDDPSAAAIPDGPTLATCLHDFKVHAVSASHGHTIAALSSHSVATIKALKELFAQCVFFQLCRRVFPHRAGAPQWVECIFHSGNKHGELLIPKIFSFSMAGSESAKQEEAAMNAELACSSKSSQHDMRRFALIREIRRHGFNRPLSTLVFIDDVRQLALASVALFVSKSKPKGDKGTSEMDHANRVVTQVVHESFRFAFSTALFSDDGKLAPLGVTWSSGNGIKDERIKAWSVFRTQLWSLVKHASGPDVTTDNSSCISAKILNAIEGVRSNVGQPSLGVPASLGLCAPESPERLDSLVKFKDSLHSKDAYILPASS